MDSQAVSRSTSVQLFRSHDPSFAPPIHLRKALSCLRALGKNSCMYPTMPEAENNRQPTPEGVPSLRDALTPQASVCLRRTQLAAKTIVSEAMARSRSRDRGRLRHLSCVGSLASGWAPGLHQKAKWLSTLKPALQTLRVWVCDLPCTKPANALFVVRDARRRRRFDARLLCNFRPRKGS